MSDNSKYRGFLEWNYLENIDSEKIKYLLKHNVIFDKTPKHYDNYTDIFGETQAEWQSALEEELGTNCDSFSNVFVFDYRVYHFNDVILNDINSIIEGNIKRFSNDILRKKTSDISFALLSLLDNQSKVDFLKETYKNILKNASRELDFEDYKLFNCNRGRKYLFEICMQEDSGAETIKYYLHYKDTNTVEYYYQDSVSEKYQTLFCKKHPFNMQWTKYYQIKMLQDFILTKIDELSPSIAQPKKSANIGVRHQVLFIDCLRQIRNEKQFSIEKFPSYFLALTGVYKSKDYEERLDIFKKLVFLEDYIYNAFSATELGNEIHFITGSDPETLRKSSAYITKPKNNESFTLNQKKDFKNYPSKRVDILKIINSIG